MPLSSRSARYSGRCTASPDEVRCRTFNPITRKLASIIQHLHPRRMYPKLPKLLNWIKIKWLRPGKERGSVSFVLLPATRDWEHLCAVLMLHDATQFDGLYAFEEYIKGDSALNPLITFLSFRISHKTSDFNSSSESGILFLANRLKYRWFLFSIFK